MPASTAGADFGIRGKQQQPQQQQQQQKKAPEPEQEEEDFWADDGEDEPAAEDGDDEDPSSLTPGEVRSRNARMVAAMSESVQGDQVKLSAIKKLSQRLRKRQLGAEAFLEELTALAGPGVGGFFSDLVLLMRVGDASGDMAAIARELKSCRREQLAKEARSQVRL